MTRNTCHCILSDPQLDHSRGPLHLRFVYATQYFIPLCPFFYFYGPTNVISIYTMAPISLAVQTHSIRHRNYAKMLFYNVIVEFEVWHSSSLCVCPLTRLVIAFPLILPCSSGKTVLRESLNIISLK